MSKLTKIEAREHMKALELLERGNLTVDEKLFVFKNYREDANHINSRVGAFFTPYGLARDFNINLPFCYDTCVKIIDLCAGIGILSYLASREDNDRDRCYSDITCVEINPDYVEVGKKLLPQAKWICGDVLDPDLLKSLGHFDIAIANPPYGNIESRFKHCYKGGLFEYMVIEAASQIADEGVFIIPQMSAPFVYSGSNNSRWQNDGKAKRFREKTGIELDFNAGFDTTQYKNDWHGVAPLCEIVCCDFTTQTKQLTIDMAETA